MARSAILGNGNLTVGIDEKGLVHDFYYPHVGLENLNSSRMTPHYIGVWIEGHFSWLHDSEWEVDVKLHKHAMITQSRHVNRKQNINISIESFVDQDNDNFIRHFIIHNKNSEPKDIRVFFHQVFQISKEGRSDTALYVPDEHYLLDYKGRCVMLINAVFEDGTRFDEYAVGNYGIEGKDGTYKDAEDGSLSMNAVEHAGVDSVIRLSCIVPPDGTRSLNYWVSVSDSHTGVRDNNNLVIKTGVDRILDRQVTFWQRWLYPAKTHLQNLSNEHKEAVVTSLLTIKAHFDNNGGIIASCDSSIYNYGRDYYSYVWPRDGAFTIWPLIKLGIFDEARSFFEFCSDVISKDGYMQHKYQTDKSIGSTWHPLVHGKHAELAIQEDETAIVLIMLKEYLDVSGDVKFVREYYLKLTQPMANFMAFFIDDSTGLPHASYDLWEEKFLSTTYSTATVYRALMMASDLAREFGFDDDHDRWAAAADSLIQNVDKYYDPKTNSFIKGFLYNSSEEMKIDTTLDVSSLYGSFKFGYYSSRDQLTNTANQIESKILDFSPYGGSARYENDQYFRNSDKYTGNPWFVTTLWMAQYYQAMNDNNNAKKYLQWALDNTTESGVLSEQIDPESGDILGVTPLVWSHAELINTILELN